MYWIFPSSILDWITNHSGLVVDKPIKKVIVIESWI